MKKQKHINVAVVGCGIFGAEIAIQASLLGLTCSVYEFQNDILCGASANNQNRLHLGFHYPRDINTARQSIEGFELFKKKYPECIQDFSVNAYLIANQGSKTTYPDYLNFCDLLNIPYNKIHSDILPFEIRGADYGVSCNEVVYDVNILRNLIRKALKSNSIDVHLNSCVKNIYKSDTGFCLNLKDQDLVINADVVINATYSNINYFTSQLGYKIKQSLFEYTVVPIIEINLDRIGVTIMDGPFITLLPYGKSKNFLLYSVEHSVIDKVISANVDHHWFYPKISPFSKINKDDYIRKIMSFSQDFVPILKEARILGFLEGPRMVMPFIDDSDARTSSVNIYENGYVTVYSGKIDHSVWVAQDIAKFLRSKFNIST